jgi:large-conductance mechanosensitive channel
MVKELKYLKFSDEDVIRETEKRLKEMKKLLVEIRDLLKTAGGFE